ncbi:MAG TPA: hypothetical protein VFC67_18720 [Prolixibacteraceae bacterium]|nr:hypothetical protein [Prolixibacteraceae bacterium]
MADMFQPAFIDAPFLSFHCLPRLALSSYVYQGYWLRRSSFRYNPLASLIVGSG